jgi:serine/threonine protein phosphatase 1
MVSRSLSVGSSSSAGPRGRRAYAIGDVHGRLDLLEALIEKIAADNSAREPAKTTIIFLGDLIDRGPHSAEVLERLRTYRPHFAKTLFLMGNHEEVLLRVLDGETDLLPDWLQFGGAECVRSYGVDPHELGSTAPAHALEILRRAIPKEHLKFIGGFADTASFGSYLFVHAGIRPGVPLGQQAPQDLRWIRAPFLECDEDHGRIVVHGHTISSEVDVRHNRIGVDTGAYRTGRLTALALEQDERWFLHTGDLLQVTAAPARVANYSEAE